MPLELTILIANSAATASRALGKGSGSALPGMIAERIDPRILGKLSRKLKGKTILVTGTNGKTTATKLISSALTSSPDSVLTNGSGSNLSRGIVSTLLANRGRHDYNVFEVDEAAFPEVAKALQPEIIVVLNLFRDQLDRYGELESTAESLGRGIRATKARLILNADDPLVSNLRQYANDKADVVFFGVVNTTTHVMDHDVASDSIHCPKCGERLIFSSRYYSHIGDYRCPNGHIRRPPLTVSARDVKSDQAMTKFELGLSSGASLNLNIPLAGFYNVYNVMAAAAVAEVCGLNETTIKQSLQVSAPAFGRQEVFKLDDNSVQLLLIKNPTGFNQTIQTFLSQVRGPVMIAINDNFADGRDVSWLWDAAIEDLAPGLDIIVSGNRAQDMALRLKYASMKAEIVPDLGAAVDVLRSKLDPGEVGYILPTYTALLEVRRHLGKRSGVEL